MVYRRTLASVLALLAIVGVAAAQEVSLGEDPLPGKYFRIEIDLSLKGEIKVQQEGKYLTLNQSAQARHQFLERILEAGTSGLADKTARFYQSASATITLNKETSERKFREDRCLMVAQRLKDQVFSFCLHGSLTREEIELTEHFDTLGLAGLLPGKKVQVGQTWKANPAAVQTLCALDGLIHHDLTGKLEKVQEDRAQLSFTGTASGISQGAAVKLAIKAAGAFGIKERRLLELEWQQTDQREQGPISPAFQAEVVTRLKRVPIEAAQELNDFALTKVPTKPTPPEEMTRVTYSDPQGRYELVHSRDWHMVGRSDRHLILRLMEQGDFVAQVTITPWKKADPGKHLAEEEFKAVLEQIPGWEQDEMLDKGSKIDEPREGYFTYRIGASGSQNGIKAVQYFYLVAGPQGDQAVLTFTMAPAQAQKLNTRDLDLVRSLTLPAARETNTPAKTD